MSTVEPFFTALLAALVLHQPLTARTFAGGAIVVAAVMLINLGREPLGGGSRVLPGASRAQ
jgi:drug/metabolite transporter (DMT)-like permease